LSSAMGSVVSPPKPKPGSGGGGVTSPREGAFLTHLHPLAEPSVAVPAWVNMAEAGVRVPELFPAVARTRRSAPPLPAAWINAAGAAAERDGGEAALRARCPRASASSH